ncbi:hypothetical protein OQA88_7008 [Cercophora sp. LCS_1]
MSSDAVEVSRALAPVDTKSISKDIKDSLMGIAPDFGTVMMSAPLAISSLGLCCAAAQSKEVRAIKLKAPEGRKFRYLGWDYLSSNLMQCVDEGRRAFDTAHGGMGGIASRARTIDATVIQIVATLADPQGRKENLLVDVGTVRINANECSKIAIEIDSAFDLFLEFVRELSQACDNQKNTTGEELDATDRDLKAEKAKRDAQERAVKSAEAMAKRMEEELGVASEAYKKASDEYPSVWDVVGAEIVKGLADSFTTFVNAAIPVMMEQLSPFKKLTTATNALGDLTRGTIDAVEDIRNGPDGPQGVPQPQPQTTAQFVSDPAFSQVKRDLPLLNLLKDVLFSGDEGGVNWEKAMKKDPKADPKKAVPFINFLHNTLGTSATNFKSLAGNGKPSFEYTAVLTEVVGITKDMLRELTQKQNDNTYTLPPKMDPQTYNWHTTFDTQYSKALELEGLSASFPGASPTGFPSITPPGAKPADNSFLNSAMDGANQRLQMTRETYIATQKNYVEAGTLLVNTQTRFAEIEANLVKLQDTSIHLSTVLEVLKNAVDLVQQVKTHINYLCNFFEAISNCISTLVTAQVTPFLEHITINVDARNNPEATGLINAYSWAESQKQAIYQNVITIRSYFSAYGDVANMWVRLSNDNIMPGMALLNLIVLERENPDARAAKARDLEAWKTKAVQNVRSIAKESMDRIQADMQKRVDLFARETKRLPPLPEESRKAIKRVAEVAEETGKKMLVEGPKGLSSAIAKGLVPDGWD